MKVSQLLSVHPQNPQQRKVQLAVNSLAVGGLVVYPTDTAYAIGCHIGDKSALERIMALRRLDKRHQFTLACSDLRELGVYARVDNANYRLLKRVTPGPFTFVLRATRDVPKRLIHAKRRTIGLRVPDHPIAAQLLALMGEPIMTTTLRLADEEHPLTDAQEIHERLGSQVDVVLDGGVCGVELSTVVDLTGPNPEIIRQGKGDLEI
jgi:tRNA threonylcarbamoyl adenosine modification protein (Sua5/YciO/YrdC/YwlC family)